MAEVAVVDAMPRVGRAPTEESRRRVRWPDLREMTSSSPEIKYYQSEVDALSQFHDLKLVDSIALKVATIKQNLAQADDDARLYNARESLFGKPSRTMRNSRTSRRSSSPTATCGRVLIRG